MTRIKIVQKADKTLNFIALILLTVILLFGLYSIWDTWNLVNGKASGSDLTHFRPLPGEASHPTLSNLKALNPDVCGWLTIDNTGIDYPVLQGRDNFQYLTMDALGNYSMLGSLYLDYQCDSTFNSPYFLIHGHHMEGSLMFGDLGKFEETEFFSQNSSGYLMTIDTTYKLEIFACLHINATDPYVYNTYKVSEASNRALLDNIEPSAVNFRNIGVSASDKILALSTCAGGQTNERTVVLARMAEQ